MSGTWISSATVTSTTELVPYPGWQMEVEFGTGAGDPHYYVSAGSTLPNGLILSTGGYLYGTVLDMDSFVPQFMGGETGCWNDHENYAVRGSASQYAGGSPTPYGFTFSVDAVASGAFGGTAIQLHTISITNNWSSDRDQLIRCLDQTFYVDCIPVTNEEYLLSMKAKGYFPGP